MQKVDRACHGCLYGDTDVYVKPEHPDLTHLNDAYTEYERVDGSCGLCGESPSLRKV